MRALRARRRADHRAIMIEHEQANGRRQIAGRAPGIDGGNHFGQGDVALRRDLLESLPKCIFEADAGLVTRDDDRALNDKRFHDSPTSSTQSRAWSSPEVPPLLAFLEPNQRCIGSETSAPKAQNRLATTRPNHPARIP